MTSEAAAPRRSYRNSRPPDQFGVPRTSLNATLNNIYVPNSYICSSCFSRMLKISYVRGNSIKFKSDVNRYKVCHAALGNRQECGLNNDDISALVPNMTTIQAILKVVVSKNWPLR